MVDVVLHISPRHVGDAIRSNQNQTEWTLYGTSQVYGVGQERIQMYSCASTPRRPRNGRDLNGIFNLQHHCRVSDATADIK